MQQQQPKSPVIDISNLPLGQWCARVCSRSLDARTAGNDPPIEPGMEMVWWANRIFGMSIRAAMSGKRHFPIIHPDDPRRWKDRPLPEELRELLEAENLVLFFEQAEERVALGDYSRYPTVHFPAVCRSS